MEPSLVFGNVTVSTALSDGWIFALADSSTNAYRYNPAPHIEAALATMYGLKADQITIAVTVVSRAEVDLHFGVYERMLAEKIGNVLLIQ